MVALSGFPKTVLEAKDASILPVVNSRGIYCVHIATQRGEVDKPVYVSSTSQFRRTFGKYVTGLKGVYEAEKMLDGGAKLWVNRVGHYTDITDKSSLVGDKADATLTVVTTAETRATGNVTITAAGVAANEIEVVSNNGTTIVVLGSYTVVNLDAVNDVAAGLRAAINLLTGTHGYVASGSGAIVIITAPVGSGAAANTYVIGTNITGATTATITQFTGGVTLIPSSEAGVMTWEGKNIGPGYDGTVISVVKNTLDNTKVDITITMADGTKNPVALKSQSRTPSAADILALNASLEDVKLATLTTRYPIGTVTLTGGVYNTGLLTDTDYVGDNAAKTGLYAFDTVTDATRISNLERHSPAVDAGYSAYVTKRVYMRAILGFPEGLSYQESLDYMNGTGSYTHDPLDNWLCSYVFADVVYYDPQDVNQDLVMSGVGSVAGLRATTDTKAGVWISHAGEEFGKIRATKGVILNAYTEQNDGGYGDQLYNSGTNFVIRHDEFGTVYWGNTTTLRDKSNFLSKENVAELVIYIMRKLRTFADKKLFKPNDPLTWNKLYREVKQFVEVELIPGRAISGKENVAWFWQGDQDVDSIDQVSFNTTQDINSGRYRARLVFVPVSAIEWIGIEVVSTDSVSIQFVVQQLNA